jgi:asparagine synthase (glutamine-hydrolysing)
LERDPRQVGKDMLASIAHRGPDEQDLIVRDTLVLAHNRLTIMEPEGGQQPRVHPDNGNILIFNGEIYGHRDFDMELQAIGCELRDHCDTETLFWLLESYGVDKTLSIIDGMFAFTWYEAASDTLYLARDRFGQKPLFYAHTRGELVFASEIKAMRRHPALQDPLPDIDALRLFLLMEYVPGDATGLQDIQQLPAGHVLTWRKSEVSVKSYWRPADVPRDPTLAIEDLPRQLEERLDVAVQQQLVADVPVGVFLSGGLDSSLIAALSKKHHDDVATFTVKFPYASFDESEHAAAVAQHLGTRHTSIELDKQTCIDGVETLLARADQPFSDSSALPSFLLCQATKAHVSVALGGDGADELFFGYPNFKLLKYASAMAHLPRAAGSLLRGLSKVVPESTDYMNRRFLLRQLSYGIGRPADEQSVYWMSAVPSMLQKQLWRDGKAPRLNLQSDPGLSLLEQCQRQFIESYLAGDILQKMDRASMNVSLEVRSPFLAAAVSEFALSLPVEASFQGVTGKRILRTVAESYLGSATINRRKHGFALPVASLLRGDLRELSEAILLDASNPMYEHISRQGVRDVWQQHVAQRRDHGKSLWTLLWLAAFFRNHF